MNLLYKYDIAISVAEENKGVAEKIVAELKKKNIRCYYYDDEDKWGEHIIDLTADAYGKKARYVLMITSKIYVKKYWSNIEKMVALANVRRRHRRHILQLRLDATMIDGLSKHVVYKDWKDNPQEIAGVLAQKVRVQKKREGYRTAGISALAAGSLLAVLVGRNFVPPVPLVSDSTTNVCFPTDGGLQPLSEAGFMNKVHIPGPGIHSFYISNTEVTIAEYRKYCDSVGKPMPPQSPNVDENGPVANITWQEAQAYCASRHGRLPTEKEWEFAASAGLSTRYSGGNNASKVAVYDRVKPQRVGKRQRNEFCLYDMTGNVAEWCADWIDSQHTMKAVRGGSYLSRINPVNELALAYRTKASPTDRQPYIGFRVAWDQ
jgi:formylglycine-generating enzyme